MPCLRDWRPSPHGQPMMASRCAACLVVAMATLAAAAYRTFMLSSPPHAHTKERTQSWCCRLQGHLTLKIAQPQMWHPHKHTQTMHRQDACRHVPTLRLTFTFIQGHALTPCSSNKQSWKDYVSLLLLKPVVEERWTFYETISQLVSEYKVLVKPKCVIMCYKWADNKTDLNNVFRKNLLHLRRVVY